MLGQYILMHSVIYRTGMLRDCSLELPMHTFYVDNIFVFQPLPYAVSYTHLAELMRQNVENLRKGLDE